jgi:hypothetical protein
LLAVFELQAHTRRGLEAKDALRVVEVQQCERGIVFVMARIKHTRHMQLFEAGHHTRWRDLPAWRDEETPTQDPQSELSLNW